MSKKQTPVICAYCEDTITPDETVDRVNGKPVCQKCLDYMKEELQYIKISRDPKNEETQKKQVND